MKKDDRKFIPYVICGGCGKETPLTYRCTMKKQGRKDIHIWSTPCCDTVPLDDSEVIKYLSINDLREMGYEKEASHEQS